MTGLADDPDAMFFNPAGLAFQSGVGATVNYVDWLPGYYEGMDYAYVGTVKQLSDRVCTGLSAAWFNPGQIDIWWDEPPSYEGPPEVWRGALAGNAAVQLTDHLALGDAVKFIHCQYVPGWVWKSMPEIGIEAGGTGNTWAADVGALWRPSAKFSLGAGVANLGPGITYSSSGEHDPSPTTLRMGACWTPLSNRHLRVGVLPEIDKVLVGMFWDTTGRVPFGRKLQAEIRDAWKALGVEITGLGLFTARLGYFEDLSWGRGGIMLAEHDGGEYRHNLCDILTKKGLGSLKSVGLCWGFGIGYKDYFRFDVSSDAAIYDFDTSNWKLSLVANDIAGGIRALKQGHAPWKE